MNIFKQTLCLFLVLLQVGCRGAYEFNLFTQPLDATVTINSQVYGVTPCEIKIPRDSELIKDHYITIAYALADGRRITKTYDLRDYESPYKLPIYIAGIIATPGVLLLLLTETDEDDQYSSFDKDDDDGQDREVQLIGLGLVGLGALIYYAFDGDFEGYDILEIFDDVNDVAINPN